MQDKNYHHLICLVIILLFFFLLFLFSKENPSIVTFPLQLSVCSTDILFETNKIVDQVCMYIHVELLEASKNMHSICKQQIIKQDCGP